jgi:hypothetical protein
VIPRDTPIFDSRDTNAVLEQFQNRRPGYLPWWNPPDKSSGAAMGPIFARLVTAILGRLNQAPAKAKLALLDLLGIRLISAQPARAPIVFGLSAGAADCLAPEGTQVAAPPPPGSTNQTVFSTEQDAAVAAAKLTELVSLWPGRDQFINHSAALAAGQPFTLFQHLQLQPTDHIIYLAHSVFLAFAGKVHLKITFELSQGSTAPLQMAWEYWDGQVWRGFLSAQKSCLDPVSNGNDGTNGLTESGTIELQAQGCQTAITSVNAVSSFWIRGRLTQTLPPDPQDLLPEVQTIRLSTQIDQTLEATSATVGFGRGTGTGQVRLTNELGSPLAKAYILVSDTSGPLASGTTESDGTLGVSFSLTPGDTYSLTVNYYGATISAQKTYQRTTSTNSFTIVVAIKIAGLPVDKAFSDGKNLDVTKAFFPFGQGPRPGSAFYFKQGEVFSKPGATVNLYIDAIVAAPPSDLPHRVIWEYWNGREWTAIYQSGPHTGDFTVTEVISFTIPVDLRPTTVNNDTGLWMRARVAMGQFGYTQSITIPTDSKGDTQTISYPVPQAPAVADMRIGYIWTKGPLPLENVFTYNDFRFEDHTADALYPGDPFAPFQPVSDVTPAVYLGFDKQLPVDNFGVYLDIAEQSGVDQGPEMIWEYWDGGEWSSVSATDETQNLALPGMITFLPDAGSQALARFDVPLQWLRGRLKEDQPPNETLVNRVFTNAVWASQWQTYQNSPLGASTGVPNQLFTFNQIPILPGQEIEVQELSGARANTEWRTIAIQVASNNPDIVTEFEALLAAEGPQTDIIQGDIHLVRDKTKKVIAVWIQWHEVQNFFDSASTDRVYVLDHAMGRLFFGDGNLGAIPPLGAAIQATWFLSGGGLAGNVQASTITQLLGALTGISGVSNPRAAEGGADGETLEEYQSRAPLTLRDRGRAIVPQDYETMAHEASAGVAVARAIATCDPSGRPVPGWITLIIIPQSKDPRPTPSAGLRQDVLNYLLARVSADVAAAQSINVIGPTYLPVDVAATLAPGDPSKAGTVEQAALDALSAFLNPLLGGPAGLGWDVGRGLYVSDIATVLSNVSGVDYVESLELYVNNVLQGDQVKVPAGQIVVAGQLRISLILPVT